MATLATSAAGEDKIKFGIPANESDTANAITHKLSLSRKVEKKDLRGRNGGYKAVMSFNETYEASIEGVLPHGSTNSGFVLGASHELETANAAFNKFDTVQKLVIEEVSVEHRNDDFAKVSVKLFGYANITTDAEAVP